MKRTPLRRVSKKQNRELARRSRLKKELLRDGPKDGSGRNLCQHCGNPPDWRGLHLVHIISLAQGGKTTRENCELWCAPCHFGPDGHRTEGMHDQSNTGSD
jgi:5-methylcytosine-specific restriction endonuclease McrA